ncbi:hypothetical protein DL764_004990 [Monosporascus ibericus]|uniref:Saccharopine dehydrogenase NADP binding domain-containing protein n=1 Tax=Monosporascus ibericus TaxID=155417 RepID=A0A4Q4TEH8_9PEZI|nr:hypothetical protein DL764_004990 [Monosporascus ibericus]
MTRKGQQDTQKLPDDIFWHLGRDYLEDPVDVLALASTCQNLWALLENEVYIADVLDIKRRFYDWGSENRCEPTMREYGHGAAEGDTELNSVTSEMNVTDAETAEGEVARQDGALIGRQGAASEADMLYNGSEGIGAVGTTSAMSAQPAAARLLPPEQGRFPPESSLDWIEELCLEYPEGALHLLACNGPVSRARKAIDAAKRFWPDYINLKGVFGQAPIHYAAWRGQLEIVRLLLESGCAVRAASEYVCWDPRPLHDIINHLTQHVAPHIRLNASKAHCLSERDRPFVIDALGFAILGDHEEVAKLLLEHYDEQLVRGMKDGWLDDKGRPIVSPIHLAALVGMSSIVEILIGKGTDPNSMERCFNSCSPLHMASTRGGTREAIKVLLDHGACLSQLDDQARTIVQWAEGFGVEDLPEWLGSLSYTGRMAAEQAKLKGLDFEIAGRSRHKVSELASALGVPYRIFDMRDPDAIDSALKGSQVFLNCAGPFSRTAEPLMRACVRNRVHYLDTSAELGTYLLAEELDQEAKEEVAMLLPGCGGSVAMLGCLVAHVVSRVVDPVSVDAALHVAGPVSRGSATSALESVTRHTLQRVRGQLARVETGSARRFDFGDGRGSVECAAVTLPDLVTICKSRGVQDVKTFVNASNNVHSIDDNPSWPDGPSIQEKEASPYHASVRVTGKDGSFTENAVNEQKEWFHFFSPVKRAYSA